MLHQDDELSINRLFKRLDELPGDRLYKLYFDYHSHFFTLVADGELAFHLPRSAVLLGTDKPMLLPLVISSALSGAVRRVVKGAYS